MVGGGFQDTTILFALAALTLTFVGAFSRPMEHTNKHVQLTHASNTLYPECCSDGSVGSTETLQKINYTCDLSSIISHVSGSDCQLLINTFRPTTVPTGTLLSQ